MKDLERKSGGPGRKGRKMNELWIIALFLVGWYVINAVVLPRLGVST